MKKYSLVFFDYEIDYFGANKQLIQATIQSLWNGIYKNRSIKLSPNTFLVRLFESDVSNFPYPKDCVEDTLNEEWQKTEGIDYDLDRIKIYVVPVKLEDIENQLRIFEKEISYIDGLEEK